MRSQRVLLLCLVVFVTSCTSNKSQEATRIDVAEAIIRYIANPAPEAKMFRMLEDSYNVKQDMGGSTFYVSFPGDSGCPIELITRLEGNATVKPWYLIKQVRDTLQFEGRTYIRFRSLGAKGRSAEAKVDQGSKSVGRIRSLFSGAHGDEYQLRRDFWGRWKVTSQKQRWVE